MHPPSHAIASSDIATLASKAGPVGLLALGLSGSAQGPKARSSAIGAVDVDMLQGLREALVRAGLSAEQAEQLIAQALQTGTPAGKKAALIRLAALAEALGSSQSQQGKAANFEQLMDALAAQARDAGTLELDSTSGLAGVLGRMSDLSADDAAMVSQQALATSMEWTQAFEAFGSLDQLAQAMAQDPLAVLAQAGGSAAAGVGTATTGSVAGASAATAAAGLSLPAMVAIGGLAALALGGGGGGGGSNTPQDTTAPAAPTLALGSGVAGGATSAEATATSGVLTVTSEAGARTAVTFSRSGGGTVTKTVTGNGSTPVAVVLSEQELSTLGNGSISVSAVATDAAGNASSAGSINFTLDTQAPDTSRTVITVDRGNKTITLDLGEALSTADLPDPAQFTITTQTLTGPAVNQVVGVAVTGGKLVLNLTDTFNAGQVNVVYIRPESGKVLEDLAGNGVVSFFSGVVADGYIRDAAIWVNPGNGVLRNTGIKTNEQGQFFLPLAVANEGSLVMVGGVNIDTGLPNALNLKAPRIENFNQPVVINPLTTLVESMVQTGSSAADAVRSVVSSLGLQADTPLLSFDPLARAVALEDAITADPSNTALQASLAVAVSTQKAAVQVVAAASLVSGADTALGNEVMSVFAAKILANSDSGVSTSFTATLNSALESSTTLGINADKLRQVSDASQDIAQADSVKAISRVQAEKLDTVAPLAPLVTVASHSKTGSPTLSLSINTTDDKGGAVIKGDLLTVLVNGVPVSVLVDGAASGRIALTEADLKARVVQITLAQPLPEGTHLISAHITDLAKNQSLPAASVSTTVDLSAPTVSLRTSADQLTLGQRASLTITFSEAITGFTQDDIAIDGGGSLSNFSKVSDSVYSADYVAPSTGAASVATVSVKASSYQDLAGNLGTVSNPLNLASANPPVVAIKQVGGADGVVSSQTNDNIVSGTAEASLPVVLKTRGGVVLGEVAADSAGTWSYSLSSDNLAALRAESSAGLVASQVRLGRTGVSSVMPVGIDLDPPALNLSTAGTPVVNARAVAATDAVAVPIAGTSDANAVIQLSLEPKVQSSTGAQVSVTRSVSANASGNWSYSFTAADVRALGQGEMKATVKVLDAAGNASSRTQDFRIDTALPSIWQVKLDAASDTGEVGDATTNKAGSTITFQASGAQAVTVSKGSQVLGSATGANGEFSYTFKAGELSEGLNNLTLRASSSTGNAVAAATSLRLDTASPDVTVSTAATRANAQTADVSYTITFSEAARGFTASDISVTNGELISSSFERVSATLYRAKVKPTAGVEGELKLSVNAGVATDLAGNDNSAASRAIPLDTLAPVAPTVKLEADTGKADNDRITGNPALLLEGVEATARTEYSANGSTWAAAFSAVQGSNTVQVRQTDAQGNVGPASSPLAFTFDSMAPAALSLALSQDTGAAGDRITSNPALSVGGQEANASVQYSADGSTWSSSFAAAEGANTVRVRQVDEAGNAGASTSLSFTLDTTAPSARAALTEVWLPGEDGNPVRFSDLSQVAGNNSPQLHGTLAGTLGQGEYIEVLDGNTVLGTFPDLSSPGSSFASSGGGPLMWSFTASSLSNGIHNFRVRVMDAAGNMNQDSSAPPLTLSINATRPSALPSITAAADDVAQITGAVPINGLTNDPTPTLSGAVGSQPLAEGERIRVYDGSTALGYAVVSNGSWSFTPAAPLSQGAHSFKVVAQSAAGNQGEKSTAFALTIDTQAPSSPQITGAQARTINTVRPEFQLSAEPGATLVLGVKGADGQPVAIPTSAYQVSETASGQYTLKALKDLAPGDYGIVAVDAAGNASPLPSETAPNPNTFRIDLAPPASLSAYLAPGFDTGVFGDQLTRLRTPQIRGLTEANANIEASIAGRTYTGKADPSGVYAVTLSEALPEGLQTVSVKASDAAGNSRSTRTSFSIDLTAPALVGSQPLLLVPGNSTPLTLSFSEPVSLNSSLLSLEIPAGQQTGYVNYASAIPVNATYTATGQAYATQYTVTLGTVPSLPEGTQLKLAPGAISDLAGNTHSAALMAPVSSAVTLQVPYLLLDMIGANSVKVAYSLPQGQNIYSSYPEDVTRFGTAVYRKTGYTNGVNSNDLLLVDLYAQKLLGQLSLASNEQFLISGDAASKMYVASLSGTQLSIKRYDIGLQAQGNLQPDGAPLNVTVPADTQLDQFKELVFGDQGQIAYIRGNTQGKTTFWAVDAQGAASVLHMAADTNFSVWSPHVYQGELRGQIGGSSGSYNRYAAFTNGQWQDMNSQDDFWMSLNRYQGRETVIREGAAVFDLRTRFTQPEIKSIGIEKILDLGALGKVYVIETEYGPNTISGQSLALVRSNSAGTPELIKATLPPALFVIEYNSGLQFQKIHVQDTTGAPLSVSTQLGNLQQDASKAVSIYQPSAAQLVAAIVAANQTGASGTVNLADLGAAQDFSKNQLAGGQAVEGGLYVLRTWVPGPELGLGDDTQLSIAQRFFKEDNSISSGEAIFMRQTGSQTITARLPGDLQQILVREARDGSKEVFLRVDQDDAQGNSVANYYHLDKDTGAFTALTASLYELISSSLVLPVTVGTAGQDSVWGTEGNDALMGLAGDDLLGGAGGDDNLRGGPGRDQIWGGTGNDNLIGGPGADKLRLGDGGTDTVSYGWASDSSGNDIDTIYGFAADDRISLSTMLNAYATKVVGSGQSQTAAGQLAIFKDSNALGTVGDNQLRWTQDLSGAGTLKLQFDTDPALGAGHVVLSAPMEIRGVNLPLSLEASLLGQGFVRLYVPEGQSPTTTQTLRTVGLSVPYELHYMTGSAYSVGVDMLLPTGLYAPSYSFSMSSPSAVSAQPSNSVSALATGAGMPADFTRFGTAIYTFSNASAQIAVTVDLATQTVLRQTSLASGQDIVRDEGSGSVTFLRSLSADGQVLTLTPYYIGLGQDPQTNRSAVAVNLPFPLTNGTYAYSVVSDANGQPQYLQGTRPDTNQPFLLSVGGSSSTEIALPPSSSWLSQVHVFNGKLRLEVGLGLAADGTYPSKCYERQDGQWVELLDRGLFYEGWNRWRGENSVLRSGAQAFDLNTVFDSQDLVDLEPGNARTWTASVNGVNTEYSLLPVQVHRGNGDVGRDSLLLLSRSNGVAQLSTAKLPLGAMSVRYQNEEELLFQQLNVKDGSSDLSANSLITNVLQGKDPALTLYSARKEQVVSAIEAASATGGVMALPGQGKAFSWNELGGDATADPNTVKFFQAYGPSKLLGLGDGGQLSIVMNYFVDDQGNDNAVTQFVRFDAQGLSQVLATVQAGLEYFKLVSPSQEAPPEFFFSAQTQTQGTQASLYMHLDPVTGELSAIDSASFYALEQSGAYPWGMGTRGNDGNLRASANNPSAVNGAGVAPVYGFGGDDRLYGFWGGSDRLYGGSGADTLYGSTGEDVLVGGPGQDRFVYGSQDSLAGDRIYGGSDSPTVRQFESFTQDTLLLQGQLEGATTAYDLSQASVRRVDRIDLMSRAVVNERIEVKISQEMASTADANGDEVFGDVRVFGYYFQDAATVKASTANLVIDASNLASTSSVDVRGQIGSGDATAPFGGMSGNDTLIGGAGNDTFWGGLGTDQIDLSVGGADWVRYGSARSSTQADGIDTLIGFGAGDKLDLSAMVSAYTSKIAGAGAPAQAGQLALFNDSGNLAAVGDNQLRWTHDAATGVFKLQFDTASELGTATPSPVMEIRGLTAGPLSIDAAALASQNLSYVVL